MPDDLTPTQSRVLDYIATHIVERQRPPTRKDIAAHFEWSSANAAEDVMQALVRKGFIELDSPDEGSTHWKRYPRVIRWPACVPPVLRLAAPAFATAEAGA